MGSSAAPSQNVKRGFFHRKATLAAAAALLLLLVVVLLAAPTLSAGGQRQWGAMHRLAAAPAAIAYSSTLPKASCWRRIFGWVGGETPRLLGTLIALKSASSIRPVWMPRRRSLAMKEAGSDLNGLQVAGNTFTNGGARSMREEAASTNDSKRSVADILTGRGPQWWTNTKYVNSAPLNLRHESAQSQPSWISLSVSGAMVNGAAPGCPESLLSWCPTVLLEGMCQCGAQKGSSTRVFGAHYICQ